MGIVKKFGEILVFIFMVIFCVWMGEIETGYSLFWSVMAIWWAVIAFGYAIILAIRVYLDMWPPED